MYSDKFRFVGVYIEEAHAVDEWPISEAPRDIRQHQSLKERLAACNHLLSENESWLGEEFSFYLDSMDNSFNIRYRSWPFRFWIVSKDRVLFKAMPTNSSYDLRDLEKFADAF